MQVLRDGKYGFLPRCSMHQYRQDLDNRIVVLVGQHQMCCGSSSGFDLPASSSQARVCFLCLWALVFKEKQGSTRARRPCVFLPYLAAGTRKILKTWVSGACQISKLRAESEAARNPETGGFVSRNVLAPWRNCPSRRADFANFA